MGYFKFDFQIKNIHLLFISNKQQHTNIPGW